MIYKKVEIKVEGYQEIADLYTYILDNSVEMRPNRKRPVIVTGTSAACEVCRIFKRTCRRISY